MDHGLSQTDALEHALGVGADTTITSLTEAREIEKLRDPVLQGLPLQSAEAAMEGDCLRTGQKFVEVGVLGKESDISTAADLMARNAKDFRGSRGGADQSEQDLERGAFAGAVGTQQSVDMACRDIEGDPLECRDLSTTQGNGKNFPEITDADGNLLHFSR